MSYAADGADVHFCSVGLYCVEISGEVKLCAVDLQSCDRGHAVNADGDVHIVDALAVFGVGNDRQVICMAEGVARRGALGAEARVVGHHDL